MGPAGLLLSQLDRRCPIVAVAVALAQLIVGGRALQRARDLCQVSPAVLQPRCFRASETACANKSTSIRILI